jgi:signal transduction histidine kinase
MSYPMLYELGLEAAVEEWLTTKVGQEQGIEIEFEHDTQPKPLDDDIRSSLFRNVQELLVNVGKHAQSHKVKVSICRVDASIHVSVEDDGVGFDPVEMMAQAAKSASFGLLSIQNRLGQLGGSVEIESAPGHGTKITMTAPLKCEEVLTVTQEGAE